MGWSTAFDSSLLAYLCRTFFLTYFSVRGVSHARIHVHNIA